MFRILDETISPNQVLVVNTFDAEFHFYMPHIKVK